MNTIDTKKKSIFSNSSRNLTEGSIIKGLLAFAFPILLGQLLQQFYNMADAWVVGNFADNAAFAAVSSSGSMIFFLTGFFQGLGVGGGVIISRYYGMKNKEMVTKALHTIFLLGLIASVAATILGVSFVPQVLRWIHTPTEVLPKSTTYFRIYCAGISAVILYNICTASMQALGDSIHPLCYLIISTFTNIGLDILLVAVFHMGVTGAAIATVAAQTLSVVLCLNRMMRQKDYTRLNLHAIRFYPDIMRETLLQGIPTGIQNSVISIGNIVIQANINAFGAYAMSGHGAYTKIEGLVFLPIMSMTMALPTFISQNLGAKQYERMKKGAIFGIIYGVVCAEIFGVLIRLNAGTLLRIFIQDENAISYGLMHSRTTTLFFCLLAFSHCCAGVLRGVGKAVIPMITMLSFWCGVRITYVTIAIQYRPVFTTVSWAYPLTWSLSSITFAIFLWRIKKQYEHM